MIRKSVKPTIVSAIFHMELEHFFCVFWEQNADQASSFKPEVTLTSQDAVRKQKNKEP